MLALGLLCLARWVRIQGREGEYMGQGSNSLHEPAESLSAEVIDRHRAIQSLMEELEAVDWYDQRVAACTDDALREILAHNRDEEKEHACMTLEWLRRNDPKWDQHLRTYLFTEGSILEREEEDTGKASGPGAAAGGGSGSGLGVGSLRNKEIK
jgi:ferritin-like protein